MPAEDLIYRAVPLLAALFLLLAVFCTRPIATAIGTLVEKVFMALYDNVSWLVLDYLVDDADRDDGDRARPA